MTDKKLQEKIIQIGLLDKDLLVLTNKGRVFHWDREFNGTSGYYPPKWKEIPLPDLESKEIKEL